MKKGTPEALAAGKLAAETRRLNRINAATKQVEMVKKIVEKNPPKKTIIQPIEVKKVPHGDSYTLYISGACRIRVDKGPTGMTEFKISPCTTVLTPKSK